MLARTKTAPFSAQLFKNVLGLCFAATCLWFVSARLGDLSFADIMGQIGQIHMLQWIVALAATWVSFWAIGRYDVVAHRHLQTQTNETDARIGGMAAIALSQTLGFGLVTGAFSRWRCLSDLDAATAAKLSAFVALSFLFGWAFVTAVVHLFASETGVGRILSLVGCAVILSAIALSFIRPKVSVFGRAFSCPSINAICAIFFWTTIDTAAAALALYALLPNVIEISWLSLFSIYLLALGAAIVSGTPGGVGPFELVLLSAFPATQTGDVLATIVAFRLVYYALPAALGVIALARPHRSETVQSDLAWVPDHNIEAARRAEVGVVRQNGGYIAAYASGSAAILATPQCLSILFDPIFGTAKDAAGPLTTTAKLSNRIPSFYKLDARNTSGLRQAGWFCHLVAKEAVLNPATFDLTGSRYRQLRRKLRQAEKHGVLIQHAGADLPLAHMQALSLDWEQRSGGARGTTMGQFEAGYVARQQTFLAFQDQRLIAFATFHANSAEWCLDLMRSAADMPDGTMHALIHEALQSCRSAGVPRMSLAAVPTTPVAKNSLTTMIYRSVLKSTKSAGLRQFKASFVPKWEPRYMAAPNRFAMIIAMAELARLILHPEKPRAVMQPIHNDNEVNEFDSRRAA